jgi:formylglycine-generating enzyme required for sulfatase activity
LGKYPLTNVEYKQFIEASGYQEKRWWTQAGWAWRIRQNRTEPYYWDDSRFNKPNQPVMGVSWNECVAYCRWRSAETGQLYRLPTEAEWEKGARGVDGRQYPWGDKFEASRLNAREGEQQLRTTTPVGIYPTGASPFGAFDCAGNVFEWCATKAGEDFYGPEFKPYPYDILEDEWSSDYLERIYVRVLRGGSWDEFRLNARCPFRAGFYTDFLIFNVGCRVLVSPRR